MRKIFLSIILIILTLCIKVNPIYAASGLTVGYAGGKGLNPEVTAGESYKQTLTASIGKEAIATDILIEVLGYGSNQQNDTLPLLPNEDSSPYSASSFIQPNQITVHCEPGETKSAQFTISIPDYAKPGGYYATLRFSTSPQSGSGSVGIIQSIVLPMKFTVLGGNLIHTGEIGGLTTSEAISGKPVEFFTDFKNTGNHHFTVKGNIEIYDLSSKLIDTIYTNSLSPVPEGIKRIKATYIPKSDLPVGIYSIKSKVMLEDGTLLDETEGSFEVEEPYVPPPAPASLTVKPDAAANLKTEDRRISISFPEGAVLSQADLALRSYPPEQLPPPPSGYIAGTTAFRVDGLNGLLAKPATLKVLYSSADLEKAAGGKAERLVLARWDEPSKQWAIAKTKLDTKSMCLTADTNQFGLWAVLGGPPKAAINWNILGAIITLVVIVFILGVFFTTRKKRKA